MVVKPKISIVVADIMVTLALLLASGYIVGSYHQAFGGGHRGHRGHRDYDSSGPLIWHPNSPIFCNSGTPSICHPSTPTMGNYGTPTMGNYGTPTMGDPGSQGEGNIGQLPGNGYPADNGYFGGPSF
jgi:hypothetical protein